MTNWNLADCLDTIATYCKERPAIIQGEVTLSWNDFRAHSESIAAWLTKQGLKTNSKVALYTYNHISYLEATYACLQASMIPVNINYRYQKEELKYLLENSDAEAILVHQDFVPLLKEAITELPALKSIIVITTDEKLVEFPDRICERYSSLTTQPESFHNDKRSSDDLIFIYTGGTTGMPKGVMWRQDDLYYSLAGGTVQPPPETWPAFQDFITNDVAPLRALVLPPLMHATAFFAAMTILMSGGTLILSGAPKQFDPVDALQLIEKHRPSALSIVGDVFARPLLNELRHNSYDISSIEFISSAGTLWSQEVKAGILEYQPTARLVDGLGSTEAHGIGASITTRESIGSNTSRFTFGTNTFLVGEDNASIKIQPGAKGLLAVGGRRSLGYYKDTKKSDQTFVTVEGQKCTISGDWVKVNDDGITFTLLGRGSLCINTGGEKVYPEEVENVIKQFPGVTDALIVGVPDQKWGEAVVAVVATTISSLDIAALRTFAKENLAAYKTPKHIIPVENVFRGPSGKADYKKTKDFVLECIASI